MVEFLDDLNFGSVLLHLRCDMVESLYWLQSTIYLFTDFFVFYGVFVLFLFFPLSVMVCVLALFCI